MWQVILNTRPANAPHAASTVLPLRTNVLAFHVFSALMLTCLQSKLPAQIERQGLGVRAIYLPIIIYLTAQSAYADNIYTFMQFDCDETANRLEIKEVYAQHFELTSIDDVPDVPGVIKDLGIEYVRNENGNRVLKKKQLPKTVGSCRLSDLKNEQIEITLTLTDIHTSRVKGLCAAASGPAFEIIFNNKAIARFPSAKDRCYQKHNPLDIARVEYSQGRLKVCRIPQSSLSSLQNLTVSRELELCVYRTPEGIKNGQDIMKDFSQVSLVHLDQVKTTQQNQQEQIAQLENELRETKSNLAAEQSRTFWQRLFK